MELHAQRVGTRTFVARNERGTEILVGPKEVEGTFTPGELLNIAMMVCAGMSADHRFTHVAGADAPAELTVVGEPVANENRYGSFTVTFTADLSQLSEEELTKLRERASAAVDRGCTIGRTIRNGASYEFRLESQ